MTDQTQDVQAVLRSQEFFRLKRVIQSPGDIFELNASTKAIYIGPDSDIGEIEVTYFNPDEPLGLETAKVSVNGPFVGRLDSSVVTQVSSTHQPARILVTPVDIVDNNYADPSSFALRRFNIPAVLDVMFSLKPLPDIPSVRADRTLRFPRVPFNETATDPMTDDGSTDLIIPIYGRRMVTVTVISLIAPLVTFGLVTLQPGVPTQQRVIGQFTVPASIPSMPFSSTAVIRASDAARQGQIFDLSMGPPPTPKFSYTESDQPNGAPTDSAGTNPTTRGMADLLVVNLKTSGAMGGTVFADVFVKIADRET
jgi:hypothetical protein